MKNYVEWADRKRLIDLKNRFSTLYQNEDGTMFYIEPVFYEALEYFKQIKPERFQDILNEMDRVVKKNKLVVFVGDEEDPITIIDDGVKAVYLCIHDITDPLGIFIQEKNAKTDYTD
ncbi:MAG: hypothetical protein LKJ88_00670 [Bacilli bacterium]|jgi:hypothetical protein|nr:hypothetical protein [Bacilli bacterium]